MNTETSPESAAAPQADAPAAANRLPRQINPALAAALLALTLVGWQWFDSRGQINMLEQTVGNRP